MEHGWAGGLPTTLSSGDLLAVLACSSVVDPDHPYEALPGRFARSFSVPGLRDASHLAGLVSALVQLDPADEMYGLTFTAAVDPLTTRLRTLTTAALRRFLGEPSSGPGRWLFTAPDHGRWAVTRPWEMDSGFVGCSTAASQRVADSITAWAGTARTARELAG